MNTKYNNAMNTLKLNGISLKEMVKTYYEQDKCNYELCLSMRGLADTEQSIKQNKYMCFVWGGIYNNDKNMYLRGRRKVKEIMDTILDDLMFGDNTIKSAMIVTQTTFNDNSKTITGDTEKAREYGNQMK